MGASTGLVVPSVSFDDLAKVYPETALAPSRDFDLEISDGEFMVLVGPSGSGKTTSECGAAAAFANRPRSAISCRAGRTHLIGRSESMKPILSDRILRDAVVNELEGDPEVAAKHISVTAIDGAITLGGHVMRDHEKHVAVRAAERVPAVRAVADDIEVRPPSLHERADDEIAEEIAHLRSWGAQIPIPDSVAAQVRDGRVILHGQVGSASQRDAAESAVRQLTGVRVVDNLIKVKPLFA
jgi:osmotically-inducible protein OsmY